MKKATVHGGRGSASHNDMRKQPGKDSPEAKDNKYWTIGADKRDPDFARDEMEWYENRYRDFLESKNQRCVDQRHPERCQSMQQLMKSKLYAPHEMILQVGSVDDGSISCYLLWQVACHVKNHAEAGGHVHVLNMALHAHETTPHVHIRYVGDYTDGYGDLRPCMDAALRLDGYDLPDPEKQTSRYNNRLTTFHRKLREWVAQICWQYDVTIDLAAQKRHKRYKPCSQFDRQQFYQERDELAEIEKQKEQAAEELRQLERKKRSLREWLAAHPAEFERSQYYNQETDYDDYDRDMY